MLKNQNLGLKIVGWVTLMEIGAVGQWLLTMMGFYYVWIQDINPGALMFLLAIVCWSLKIQAHDRLSKRV